MYETYMCSGGGAIKLLLTMFIVLILMAFKDVYIYLGVYNKKKPPTKYAIIIA